jgi:deoxyribonuclease V
MSGVDLPSSAAMHPWDVSPKEAVRLQRALAPLVRVERLAHPPRLVAGIDVGVKGTRALAAAVLVQLPELCEVERALAIRDVAFPYVPGLLSFREAPSVLEALSRLHQTPDLLVFDGQGVAHPRRLGIASHVGVLLDRPAVGCAKSRLVGTHDDPPHERGGHVPLMAGDEQIGAVVRTRTGVRPLFVSVGHRVSLEDAVRIVLDCGSGYRLPEPTRLAHRVASTAAREL